MEKQKFRYRNEDDYFSTMETMKDRFVDTEKQLKEQHGIFYNIKLNKKIKKKLNRRSKF